MFAVLYFAGVIFTIETPGGTLIVEVNEPNAKVRMIDGNQTLVRYIKREGQPVRETHGACRFVPLVGKFGWPA